MVKVNSLIKNLVSLGSLQAVNFAIPIITAPYIIRTVGLAEYGSVNVALALVSFFSVISDYGFNLSAPRNISLYRNDREYLSRYVSKVLACKGLLLASSLIIYLVVVFVVADFKGEWPLFLLSFPIVVGNTLLPTWFYQGIEDVKLFSYIVIIFRIVFAAVLFIFISETSDYIYINLINATGMIGGAVIGLYWMVKRYGLRFVRPDLHGLGEELKAGFLIFVSNISSILYTFSNLLILNFLSSDKVLVGQYSVVEKILTMIKQVLVTYSQVVYPHLCNLATGGFNNVKAFFKKSYLVFFGLVVCGSIALSLLAPWIIQFFTGKSDDTAVFFLRLVSVIPCIIALNIPFFQILTVYNFKKGYSSVLTSAAVLNIALNFILTSTYSAVGTIASIILTESFIVIALFLIFRIRYYQRVSHPDYRPQ
ncbi:oligosaccharide flippase family protein [Chryseolinea sp. T2]|uniref:oligosaccharide flippase family protein n=1 Tax=Chryseolinea sp. T2 TaxID=3129255 RepID=UPI003077D210